MAPTGSLDKAIATLALVDWNNRQALEASDPFKAFTTGLENTLDVLNTVAKSGDINQIVNAESTLVSLEHMLHQGKDPSVMSSLSAAAVDFSVIHKDVALVKDAEAYKIAASSYHAKKRVRGVVIDGCHEALNAHVTRLGNRMSAVGISVPEKNVLRQRQTNMRTAKDLYVGLQCRALGVEPPGRR